jgi:hypothetical protein
VRIVPLIRLGVATIWCDGRMWVPCLMRSFCQAVAVNNGFSCNPLFGSCSKSSSSSRHIFCVLKSFLGVFRQASANNPFANSMEPNGLKARIKGRRLVHDHMQCINGRVSLEWSMSGGGFIYQTAKRKDYLTDGLCFLLFLRLLWRHVAQGA